MTGNLAMLEQSNSLNLAIPVEIANGKVIQANLRGLCEVVKKVIQIIQL